MKFLLLTTHTGARLPFSFLWYMYIHHVRFAEEKERNQKLLKNVAGRSLELLLTTQKSSLKKIPYTSLWIYMLYSNSLYKRTHIIPQQGYLDRLSSLYVAIELWTSAFLWCLIISAFSWRVLSKILITLPYTTLHSIWTTYNKKSDSFSH